jgi:hypothetical protein
LNGSHGRGFSGAHGSTGFSGQHFTITGGLGIAGSYPGRSFRGGAAGCVALGRYALTCSCLAFASLMFGDAAVYFLFPCKRVVGLLCRLSQSSRIPSCAARGSFDLAQYRSFRSAKPIAFGASRTLLSGAVEGTRGIAGVVRIGLSVTSKINPIITCGQSYVACVPFKLAHVCYPEPWNRS